MTTLTMTAARKLYSAGNNAGEGYSPAGDTVDAAAADLGTVVLPRQTSDEVAVVLCGNKLIAVGGDAMGGNPWAVEIVNARTISRARDGAGQAGDEKMVETCDRADAGDRDALITFARIISEI